MTNAKKKVLPFIGLAVLILVVIGVVALANKKSSTTPGTDPVVNGEQTQTGPDGETPADAVDGEETPTAADAEMLNPVLEGAKTTAPGADLVSKEGKVINQSGEEVKTDVSYMSPEAPKQTLAITKEEAASAIQLTLNNSAFTPNEFTVNAGQAITIALTGADATSHVLAFRDSSLQAVYINIRPGETRAVTFNAPSQAGRYEFFCDFPGHSSRGEVGTMIVK